MEYKSLSNEKTKEQQGIKRKCRKKIACMRTMTAAITETGYRACGVGRCGMTVIRDADRLVIRGAE